MARKLTDADKVKVFDRMVSSANKIINGKPGDFFLLDTKEGFEETKERCSNFIEVVSNTIKDLGIKHEL